MLERIEMVNMILMITSVTLILILLALLVIIVLEYRAKRSFDHYIMENENGLYDKGLETERKGAAAPQKRKERTIPLPDRDGYAADSGTGTEPPPQKPETESPAKPQFKQYPPLRKAEPKKISKADEIRRKSYTPFTHQRLVETMGLSDEEADEFVLELIHQLEDAIAELDELVERGDFERIEHVTHGLKGAATNIGSGGVADILVDYNTEMKNGKDPEAAQAYQELLKSAVSDLKIEYSQVA